ncbi:MAG: type II toxin-antitoxin system RelE/ParE family toxin [Planctomycetes bacterium]|nr:type II toxin-antitoxin system RelE/ParE family toxin [Planctomycetota bacterium]MBU4398870.1 type II toxin-antitoxin system RelE/ParE family toxin [Planctomycetota bacterium]
MASYRIEWKASAVRELKRLDRSVVPRIVEAVGQLARNPFPRGCRKLKGSGNSFRIRVGDYRVVYEIAETLPLVEVVRVRHRKDAYR